MHYRAGWAYAMIDTSFRVTALLRGRPLKRPMTTFTMYQCDEQTTHGRTDGLTRGRF